MAIGDVITGPWVGSSAKSATGISWMGPAGASVQLPPPFMMSQLIGRSLKTQVVFQHTQTGTTFNPASPISVVGAQIWTPTVKEPTDQLVVSNGQFGSITGRQNFPDSQYLVGSFYAGFVVGGSSGYLLARVHLSIKDLPSMTGNPIGRSPIRIQTNTGANFTLDYMGNTTGGSPGFATPGIGNDATRSLCNWFRAQPNGSSHQLTLSW